MPGPQRWKEIRPVPSASEFVDIVLSRTQRRTPTVVHPQYAIGRIRSFYMRKVKYTQATFAEKLGAILESFPRLDDIHPFYADLCNVLYDRDHYKLALGQINTANNLIGTVSKDYVRLLKYGDSQYRCKQLKRAALGRMCTIMKKQRASLAYLEEVRKHLSRLPSIDPNTRTLLITGYPNVGKSSFMNKVTRADVEVQPYAFTTKSLFVGHMDYKYLRWQVIDTPGILDKPLEERNTIEMQAITALAHLQCCVLYFMDLSEQCGWTLEQQAALFDNIRPLFANKPLIIVANKTDLVSWEHLESEKRDSLERMAKAAGAMLLPMSSFAETGLTEVKRNACESLLARRVETKMKSAKLTGVLNRLSVVVPAKRDAKTRGTSIPASVISARAARAQRRGATAVSSSDDVEGTSSESAAVDFMETDSKRRTEKDVMWENGGPGVYSADLTTHYVGQLRVNEWRHDPVPEIMNGKNIADFIDPEIMERLKELEQEEEQLAADAAEEEEREDGESDLDEEEKEASAAIRKKKRLIVDAHRREKNKNRPTVQRKHASRGGSSAKEFREGLEAKGYDASTVSPPVARGRKRTRSAAPTIDSKADEKGGEKRTRSRSRAASDARSLSIKPDGTEGLRNVRQKIHAKRLRNLSQRKMQSMGKAGEADRHIAVKMPKHLYSGKRGIGKTQRR